jgi:ABC-type uncharacterized transport system ATPase subunit
MVYKNDYEINSVALSPTEGELIAGDQNGKMMIYDLVAGKVRAEMVKIYFQNAHPNFKIVPQ